MSSFRKMTVFFDIIIYEKGGFLRKKRGGFHASYPLWSYYFEWSD